VDPSTRLLLDSEIGSNGLGYKFPSTVFGPAIEIPRTRHLELEASAAYSPDKKVVTNDGHSFRSKGAAIIWTTSSVGLTAEVERSWLWTSQFSKSVWYPSAGVVVRNGYFGPGRLT
jgi:hypothetical protein